MKIAYLVPDERLPGGFWDVLVDITRCAAERLGINLEVISCGKDRDRMLAAGMEIVRRPTRPDCVLFNNYLGLASELVPALDAAGIDAFLLVEGMPSTDRLTHGTPRTKHPHWIGELFPDDVAAGRLLARILVERARAAGHASGGGKIHVGVVCGDQTSAGQARFRGWHSIVKEEPDVVQASVLHAGWDEFEARSAAERMLRLHPEISVVWAANDAMAFGVVDAIRDVGRRPGKDVLVGGMDLLPRSLALVEEGSMTVTLGGHILDGARALLLVHDRRKGYDFEPASRRSLLEPVTAENADAYARYCGGQSWRHVEFERYSRERSSPGDLPELTLASLVDRWSRAR